MKLLRAEITGFGKYRQATFDFVSGNQLFFGANEAGKSTLYQFIQAMLFGFPTKRGNKKDYTPKDGASFGGKLWLSFPEGEVCVERYKQINRGRAKVTLGEQTGDDRLLASLIAPLNQQLFQEVFTFQQEQLSQLEKLQERELHDALISLGISGSKQLLEKRQEYLNDAQKLFKHKGQKLPLNQKLAEWQELRQKIHEKEQQESDVQNYYGALATAAKQQTALEEKIEKTEEQLTALKQQQLYWSQYEELQRLKKKLRPGAPVDEKALATFYQTYQQLNQQIIETQAALDKALSQTQNSDRYTFYLTNEGKITALLQEKVAAARLTDEFQQKLQQQSQAIERLDEWERTYPWDPSHLPVPLTASFFEKVKESEQLERQIQELILKKEWLAEEKPTVQTKPTMAQSVWGWSCVAAAGLLFISSFFIGNQLLLILLAVLFAGLGLFFFRKQPSADEQTVKKEKSEQLFLIQEKITALKTQQGTLLQAIEESVPDYRQWSEEQKSGLVWYQQDVTGYLETTKALEEIDQQLASLDQNYQGMLGRFHFLEDWLPLAKGDILQRMAQLQQFADEMNELKLQQTHQSSVLLTRQLEEKKEQQSQLIAKNQPLLTQAGINQPSEIPWWLERMREQAKAWQRKKELEELLHKVYPEELSAEELHGRFTQLSQQLNEGRHHLRSASQESQRLQLIIQQLQVDGTLDELYQESSKLTAEIQSLALSWGIKKQVAAFLSDLTTELSEQQLPQLLAKASHYFSLLTNNRYQQITISSGNLAVKNTTSGQPLSIYELSTGTKDQVIMAVRFGYLALQQNHPLCPVMIDDGWLHYDSQRKRQFAQLLKEFSKKYQVICLSSDAEMVSLYQEYQQPVMEMRERK